MYGEAGTAEGPPPAGGSPTRTKPLITINSTIQEESDRREGKVVAAGWGMELIQIHAALESFHQDYLKKWMNRRTDT